MTYVFGALAGLAWGAVAALINMKITKKCIEKNNTSLILAANIIRTFVDVLFLAAIFLTREFLPFSYAAAMVCTAISLSVLTIFFSYRLAKPDNNSEK